MYQSMPGYAQYSVLDRFRGTLINITNQMVQRGQINVAVQQAAIQGFDANPNAFVAQIMSRFMGGRAPETLTDQELASRICDYINRIITNMNMRQYNGYVNPGYEAMPYGNNQFYPQQPSNVFVPQPSMSMVSPYQSGPVTPASPAGQPMAPMGGIIPPPKAEEPVQEETKVVQTGYLPPREDTKGEVAFKNTLGDGAVTTFVDAIDHGKRLGYATMTLAKSYTTPVEALIDVVRATEHELCEDSVILAKFTQLKAYDVSYDAGKKALKEIKELVKNTPANGKHTFISKIFHYLSQTYYQSDFIALESIFKDEFNERTSGGAVFKSTDNAHQDRLNEFRFEVRSLADIPKMVEPKSNAWEGDVRFGSQEIKDRIVEIARDTILAVAKDIVLVDPTTTEGLLDYLKIYGDCTTEEGFVINNILAYVMMQPTEKNPKPIAVDGKKYTPAEACAAIMTELKKHIVVKIPNKNLVYSGVSNGLIDQDTVYYDNQFSSADDNYSYLMAFVHNVNISHFYHAVRCSRNTMAMFSCVYGSDKGCIFNPKELV